MSNEKNTPIVVLDGYGLDIRVEKGHLVCRDGIAKNRREFRFSRISKLKRLVVLGHTGAITFDAIRFLHDLGAALVMIDDGGELLLTEAAMMVNWATLRKVQALTIGTPKGFELLKGLLRDKLIAQGMDTGELERAETAQQLQTAESHAAAQYFLWDLDIPWDKPVPEHWTRWTSRKSVIGNHSSNRRATDSINSVLNYCCAILESEVKIACMQMGLELGFGLMHDDARAKGRPDLVFDLMEPLRPMVDQFVKQLAANGFRKEHFHEGRDGAVRILAPLTHILAQQGAEWRYRAQMLVEDFCAALMDGEEMDGRSSTVPTPLTERKRKAGIAAGKRRRAA